MKDKRHDFNYEDIVNLSSAYSGPTNIIHELIISRDRTQGNGRVDVLCTQRMAKVKAATLAIACKHSDEVQTEIFSSPNLIPKMNEYISYQLSKRKRMNFKAISFLNSLSSILHGYCNRENLTSNNETMTELTRFILSSCMSGGIVHGFILHFSLVDNTIIQTSNIVEIMIRGLRLFFHVIKSHVDPSFSLKQCVQSIPVGVLLRTSVATVESIDDIGNHMLANVYGLIGDVLALVNHANNTKHEVILFEALHQEKVIETLLTIRSGYTESNTKHIMASKAISLIVVTILDSKMMSADNLNSKQSSIIFAIGSIMKKILLIQKTPSECDSESIFQWISAYVCLCRIVWLPRLSYHPSSNVYKLRNTPQAMKAIKTRKLQNQILNKFLLLLDHNFILTIMWCLIHPNQSIQAKAEEALYTFGNNILNSYGAYRLLNLLRLGIVQVMFGIREQCRLEQREIGLLTMNNLLHVIRNKIFAQLKQIVTEENPEVDSVLGIISYFVNMEKKSSIRKYIILKECVLLSIVAIQESKKPKEKIHKSVCKLETFPLIKFGLENNKDIFLCLRELVNIFVHIVRCNTFSTSSALSIPHIQKNGTILDKLVVANVYCEDKGVIVMMECASFEKLMSMSTVLGSKAIAAVASFQSQENLIVISGVSVPSYEVFEEYTCHIDVGVEVFQKNWREYNAVFCLQLIIQARDLGSEHLIPNYFDLIFLHYIDSTNCINILKVAQEVSSSDGLLRTLQYLCSTFEVFSKAMQYISKQRLLEDVVNKMINFNTATIQI